MEQINKFREFTLKLLYMVGQNPFIYDLFSKISTCISLFCSLSLMPVVFIKMISEFNDVDVVIPTFESLMSLYQVFAKVFICYLRRKKLTILLHKMDARFWKIENIEVGEMAQFLLRFVYIYTGLGGFLTFGFAIKPFFNTGRQMPLMCWTPDGNPTPYYQVVYAMQAYVLFSVVGGVVGFDLLYMYMNFIISVQFKLLRYELNHVVQESEKDTMLKLKKCCQHHQFLLDCCEELMDLYSFLLLNQYFIFVITICVELYSMTESNDPVKIVNCIMYLVQIGFEAGLICIVPTIIEDESGKVATAVYLSDWYKVIGSKEICKSMIFLMKRSQRSVEFTAGGLFAMNVQCLKNIVNTGFSFYTLMKNRKHT